MTAFQCKTLTQLADILGISPQDLWRRKKADTLNRLIETKCYKRNVNYGWVLTGEGEMSFSVIHGGIFKGMSTKC